MVAPAAGRGNPARSPGLNGPLLVSVQLAAVEAVPAPPDTLSCPSCGSRRLLFHQRLWRALKDPDLRRVLVLRYQCKRCGRVRRVYPVGVGPGRLSAAVGQIVAVLGCAGLSYQNVATVLRRLGTPVALWSVARIVAQQGARPPHGPRLRLSPDADGWLRGRDGAVRFGLRRRPDGTRWLEAEVAPGPNAFDLRDRLARCFDETPPETA
jgi:DNA-directed RNA polymerase subunit RPC12/RpoP